MEYNFGQLYGMADNSNILYAKGVHDAVVEKSAWGRTKDGSKGQWSIGVRITTGENAGRTTLTQTLTISPDNPKALGILFRHLGALGIPVPDPQDQNRCLNGQAPFWVMGWSEEQVARAMIGRPVQISIDHEEYDGVTRNKIKDWKPPRPGAPTTWPEPQAAPQQAPYGQQPWGQPQPQYGQPQPGYPAQQPGQAPWGQPPAHQYPPQGAPAVNQPQYPGAPSWAQPPVPGQGGTAEFTPGGQSWQPSHMDPGQQAPQFPQGGAQAGWVPGAPGQPQQFPAGPGTPGAPDQGAYPGNVPGPGMTPPWQQGPPPGQVPPQGQPQQPWQQPGQVPQPPWQQGPPPAGPQQQAPGDGPPVPPWAQQ